MGKGDIMGHEPMGIVREVGGEVQHLKPGDRVVIPFNIACGSCWMCRHGLQTQCEVMQVRSQQRGAALYGYTKLYGEIPGGQAEYMRVLMADYCAIKVPDGPPDERFLYLSDVVPTAWQAVQYADPSKEAALVVLGLGPIGDMATRVAQHLGIKQVIGMDLVPERLKRARDHDIQAIDISGMDTADIIKSVQDLDDGRGPDAVIDAVGMEAHGSPGAKTMQQMTTLMPDAAARQAFLNAGVDRLAALHMAIEMVRRGGTVSISGVYAGHADPISMDTLFDKQITLRMGQANVRRWSDQLRDILVEEDAFGVEDFATHRLPLEQAPEAYEKFQKKQDGYVKVVLKPKSGLAN
jgi:threonine dehydrogenase-like Zn-dependent dehydrogenase